jgi:alanyl-tRNA synthetase
MKEKYIIIEHIRAVCFLISDGVRPSGKGRGYILRRLMRRSLAAALKLKINIDDKMFFQELVESYIDVYLNAYPELSQNKNEIIETLFLESQKYQKAIRVGEKEWAKILA